MPAREPTDPSSQRSFWRQDGEVTHVDNLGVPAHHRQREEAFLDIFPAFSIAAGTTVFTLEENGPLSWIAQFLVLRCSWSKFYRSVKLNGMRSWAFSFLLTMPWDVAKDPKWHLCTSCAMSEEMVQQGATFMSRAETLTSVSTSRQ